MNRIAVAIVVLLAIAGFDAIAQAKKPCNGNDACCNKNRNNSKKADAISARSMKPLACRLTSKELQERKATVIAALKKEVIERKELPDGYSFKFKGDDENIDRLTSFIKSERACCGFFTFNLSITEEFALLKMTGPKGTKDFINVEIGM